MKCSIDGNNARIMAKAIQSLGKFGTDLFIEADKDSLQLRSVNATRSAVGTFRFYRTFFETYRVQAGDENYCKISMKACLQVFRNMKQVEHCELRILINELKFQIQLRCRLETVKTALLSIVDEENIDAAVSPDNTTNCIVGSHKIFNEISSNFNSTEEEITLEASKLSLTAKNYMEGTRVGEKFMRSQLKLNSAEFEKYSIASETNVTFCLKEFRAILMFAEHINEYLKLQFEEAGSPIFMRIKKYDQVECLLIMSTLSPEDISFHEECRESEITHLRDRTIQEPRPNTTTQKRKNTREQSTAQSKRRIAEATTLSNNSTLFQFNDDDHAADDGGGGGSVASTGTTCMSVNVPRQTQPQQQDEDYDDAMLLEAMSIIEQPPPHIEPRSSSELTVAFIDTAERNAGGGSIEKDSIPQSPTRQDNGVRKIFSRCFLSTYVPREPSPSSQVYVPNSDSED